MKKLMILAMLLFLIALDFALFYGIGAFVLWQANPAEWTEGARLMTVIMAAVSIPMVVMPFTSDLL